MLPSAEGQTGTLTSSRGPINLWVFSGEQLIAITRFRESTRRRTLERKVIAGERPPPILSPKRRGGAGAPVATCPDP